MTCREGPIGPAGHSFPQAGESLSTGISEPLISTPHQLRAAAGEEPSIGGLALSAWIKIGIVGEFDKCVGARAVRPGEVTPGKKTLRMKAKNQARAEARFRKLRHPLGERGVDA